MLKYNAGSERKIIHSILLLTNNTDIYKNITIIDLREPFEKFNFHHPKQFGSISLKNVAHALCDNINFEGLVIKNGRQAMNAYEDYLNCNDLFKRMEIKQELINYSEMDVKALMEILKVLNK